MTQNARVFEERLTTGEGVQIGAAHADATDAHQGLARRRSRRMPLGRHEFTWPLEHDLEHQVDCLTG